MRTLNFKDPQGRILIVNSPDGSVPSEQELDDMFARKYGQIQQSSQYTYGQAIADTGKTALKSAGNLISNVTFPIRHPGQAIKGIGQAVTHPIQTAKAIGGYAKERYGSSEKIAETVATDPFGFVGDVLGVGGLVGGLRPRNLPMTTQAIKSTAQATVSGVKKTGQVVTAPYRYAKDLIQTPAKAKKLAKEAIFDIEQNTRELTHGISKKAELTGRIKQKNYSAIEKGYADLDKTLDYAAQKAGQKEILSLQKELPVHFSRMSTKYGGRLKGLIEGKNITVQAQKVVDSIEQTLLEKGIIRFDPQQNGLILARSPKTGAETKIYDAYQNTKNLISNAPEATIDIQDLIRTNNVIKPKYGKQWTPDEHMQAGLVEKLSQHINDAVPGIKQLKTEFRPYLQWKDKIIKRLKPFAGERDTKAGTVVISKLGTKELSFDDKRMLAELEKQIGREVGGKVKAYRKGQETVGIKKGEVKAEAQQVLQNLKDKASEEVFRLRQNKNISVKTVNESVDKIVSEYTKKRIIAGTAVGVTVAPIIPRTFFKYFLRREIFNVLHGREL